MNYLKFCSIAVTLLLLGAGSAEAQQCFTRATNLKEVRAEGLTEVVGDVQLVCRPPATTPSGDNVFGGDVPMKFTVALELSSNITNEIGDTRTVTEADSTELADADFDAYTDKRIGVVVRELTAADNTGVYTATGTEATEGLGKGTLSSDGETITWTVYTADDPDTDETEAGTGTAWATAGFSAVFSRVRVNAAAVGDGEDVMANVLVGGTAVNSTPLKLADVTTGLETPVTAKSGDQCADGNIANAMITVKEGFPSAFMNGDSFVVSFSGVPEGVSIMMEPDIMVDAEADDADEMFRLVLEKTNPRTSGVDKDNMVMLSNAGTGSVRYNIMMSTRAPTQAEIDAGNVIGIDGEAVTSLTDDMVYNDDLMSDGALEWQHITPTFKWEKNAVDLGMVMVAASFHPVSDHAGDTFMTGGAAVPRFMDASEAMTIATVKDCTSQLFYPFVTSASGYDTGIVVSNTSGEAGSCSATYSGMGAPEDSMELGEIMPGMQSVHLVSSHVEDFSGYLTVNCDTVSASGFAHVVDTSGLAGSQGYIAE